MPFGLHSAPATFQRALDSVITPELEPHAFAYLDDIIVPSPTLEEHIRMLRDVLRRLRADNLRINPAKCDFFKQEVKYLGHVVSGKGIHTDPDKVAAIQSLPAPTNVKGIRQFLGVASWYRRFVPDFATLSQPLTSLLKKGRHFKWGEREQTAFSALKEKLTEAPVLACPDFAKRFTLQTDASRHGLGAVLTQEWDGQERVIAYASRHLNSAEQNYSPTEQECLAIVWGIRKMRPYLEGYEFTVITDHLALKWLNSIESPAGRIARWTLELQQYRFEVQYRRGKLNVVADALSREPQLAVCTVQIPKRSWLQRRRQEVLERPDEFPDYHLENGQLYRNFPTMAHETEAAAWNLCVDGPTRLQVLQENHDQPGAGHLGVRKTQDRVLERYYWPGALRDIRKYVLGCLSCQQYKVQSRKAAGQMLSHRADQPWDTLCADFTGPLPRSKHGNTMLLVFFDKCSKWVELVPLRRATSETFLRAFRERILARFATPREVLTDNGTQFACRSVARYFHDIGVTHVFTAPYTPQENPTERANRTVKTMIAQLCGDRQTTWDDHLPELTLAINTARSESTGFSPAYVVFGRQPRLPNALFDKATPGSATPAQTPEQHAETVLDILAAAQRQNRIATARQAKGYNLRRRLWKPEVGHSVMVRTHPLSKAVDKFSAKLAPKYEGPYRHRAYN